jgi:hypothetical protein
MNSSVHEFKAAARGLWIVNSRLQTLDFFPSDFNLASVYIHSQ